MANKYFGSDLTLTNRNFFGACKAVAEKMTEAELKAHTTLAEILNGLLAGHDAATVGEYQKAHKIIGNGKINADTWYRLFN